MNNAKHVLFYWVSGYIPREGLLSMFNITLSCQLAPEISSTGEPSHLQCPWAPVSSPLPALGAIWLSVARLMGLWGTPPGFAFLWLLCRCAFLHVRVPGKDSQILVYVSCLVIGFGLFLVFSFFFFSYWFEGNSNIYDIYYIYSILLSKNLFIYSWPCWVLWQQAF